MAKQTSHKDDRISANYLKKLWIVLQQFILNSFLNNYHCDPLRERGKDKTYFIISHCPFLLEIFSHNINYFNVDIWFNEMKIVLMTKHKILTVSNNTQKKKTFIQVCKKPS